MAAVCRRDIVSHKEQSVHWRYSSRWLRESSPAQDRLRDSADDAIATIENSYGFLAGFTTSAGKPNPAMELLLSSLLSIGAFAYG